MTTLATVFSSYCCYSHKQSRNRVILLEYGCRAHGKRLQEIAEQLKRGFRPEQSRKYKRPIQYKLGFSYSSNWEPHLSFSICCVETKISIQSASTWTSEQSFHSAWRSSPTCTAYAGGRDFLSVWATSLGVGACTDIHAHALCASPLSRSVSYDKWWKAEETGMLRIRRCTASSTSTERILPWNHRRTICATLTKQNWDGDLTSAYFIALSRRVYSSKNGFLAVERDDAIERFIGICVFVPWRKFGFGGDRRPRRHSGAGGDKQLDDAHCYLASASQPPVVPHVLFHDALEFGRFVGGHLQHSAAIGLGYHLPIPGRRLALSVR